MAPRAGRRLDGGRVENDGGRPVVHVHELDPATRTYALTGAFHERPRLPVPFPVELSLTALAE